MADVHPSARVDPKAQLAKDVQIGPGCVIGPDVKVGTGTKIETGAVLERWVSIGKNCQIFPYAIIGTAPQDTKYKGARSYVRIGDNNIIREFTTIHRGTDEESATVVGNDSYLMAYCHLGHNAKVGNNVMMINGANLGGWVVLEDMAYISAFVMIHQFIRIGELTLVGPLSRPTLDVPPYLLTNGNPLKTHGLNVVGLQRAGVSDDVTRSLKQCYRLLSRSKLNISEALKKIEKEVEQNEKVKHFVEFIRTSKKGIHR